MDTIDLDTLAELSTPLTGWLRLDRVSYLLEERRVPYRPGRLPSSLRERAAKLRLDTSPIARNAVAVRARDLGRLFSPSELAAVEDALEALQQEAIDLRTARALAGMKELPDRELVGLLSRRGIAVAWPSPHGAVSLSGACWLSRLLAEERTWRPDDPDLFPAHEVLPYLRPVGPESVEGEPAVALHDREILSASEELARRCRIWDIRGPGKTVDEGWRDYTVELACGWDCFRLCGAIIPGADIDEYRRRLKEAYTTVIGVRPDVEATASESEPAPEPGPESGQVMARGGRRFAVEVA